MKSKRKGDDKCPPREKCEGGVLWPGAGGNGRRMVGRFGKSTKPREGPPNILENKRGEGKGGGAVTYALNLGWRVGVWHTPAKKLRSDSQKKKNKKKRGKKQEHAKYKKPRNERNTYL